MAINNRTSLSFVQLSDPALDDFAANVILSLTGNTGFPNLPVSVVSLGALRTDYHTKLVAAAQGGTPLTAAKDEARLALENALRQDAAYVQSIAGQNLALLLTSGFKATSTNRTQSPLQTPIILNIDNQSSSQLMIDLKSVDNAATYQVKVVTSQGVALPTVESTRARGIVAPDLVPGDVYTVQARAIGGSTGYSNWSNPTSCMAT